MGYSTVIAREPGSESWVLAVRVNLSRRESTSLFLSGDEMISWPADGLQPESIDDLGLERSGMFVSEMAARPEGLRIHYGQREQAERAVAVLRAQFVQIGIHQEA